MSSPLFSLIMRHSFYLLVSFCLSLLTACTPSTDNSLLPDVQPVVQAYLVPGQPVSVQVFRQTPFTVDTTGQGQPINDLSLTITTNNKAYPLRAMGNGTYQSGTELVVKTGQTYQLDFEFGGRHVSGNTVIPTRPVSFSTDQTDVYRTAITLGSGNGGFGGFANQATTPVSLTWSNPTGDYYFVVVDNIELNPVEIITRPTSTGTAPRAARRFRSQPVQSDFTTIQAQSFQYFGKHRVVLYHLNPDYAALYKQNSTSTQNISTPPTALTNGLGLFTGLNADTLYVTVKPQ